MSSLKRENQSLRRRIAQMEKDHATTINAKTRALDEARAGSILFELGPTYPHLRQLIRLLNKAHAAAVPLKSPTGDGRSVSRPTPLESGASTKRDRKRTEWIDLQLENLCEGIKIRMTEQGPLEETGSQCWEPDCPSRGWFQAFDAVVCATCATPFGRHKPLDRTQIGASAKRCWTRGCPQYSKTNQCEHTLGASA